MDNSKDDAWTAKNNMHFKKKKKKKKVGRVERESVRGQSLMRIKVVYKRLPFITTKKIQRCHSKNILSSPPSKRTWYHQAIV